MNKIAIGKYVTTHGIKGEIRIKSDFNEKDKIFKVGNEIIIDKPYIINSYRVHKGYDMVTLVGINRIEDVINLKNSTVYIDRDKYFNDEVIEDDLIGYKVENSYIDTFLSEIRLMTMNKKMLVCRNGKFIPYELIDHIDNSEKIIYIKEVEGL
jgi:16S rRNA processing protein RimM